MGSLLLKRPNAFFFNRILRGSPTYNLKAHPQDTAHRVTFFGQEKTATTIRLAKMNLTVHGLEGDIREANTFYDDVHTLVGKCDFVMANPPFNVDMVDAEKVEGDLRLPFGLPGVNKQKKVSNGNYLWISYFYSYLNATGRAGFVMSSQASRLGIRSGMSAARSSRRVPWTS
jgi:type I restriction enzyme M protein